MVRKSGLQMLLSSLGIEIDPAEVMKKYNEAKDVIPKLAVFVQNLDARLARIEERLGIHDAGTTGSNRLGNLDATGTFERTGSD